MWLLVLSLLALESVQSATIGYPYRSLWTYNPPQSSSIHSYLRYLDNNAAGSVVGINNLQPVYAIRQIKYFNGAPAPAPASALETLPINNAEETAKARATYLRAASFQQYQNLKTNVDALRAEGKEPSADKLSKLQVLEKIAFTSDFSLIADLPEVKSTLQDLEASINALQRESVQHSSNQQTNIEKSPGEIKTYVGNSKILPVAIDETPEQKQAHTDHLRIYKEQIAHLKQLELEHEKYVQQAAEKSNKIPPSSNEHQPIVEPIDNSRALAELERAQAEHLRLWNEAKLRAEQAGETSGEKGVQERANTNQQISELTNDQNSFNPKQTSSNNPNPEAQQFNKQFEQQNVKSAIPNLEHTQQQQQQLKEKANLRNEQLRSDNQQQLHDTPAVVRALEQPQQQQNILPSLFKEAEAKISSEYLSQLTAIEQAEGLKSSTSFVEETAEVKKARADHLRLVHEANLRAQYVEQQELKYKQESQTPILKAQQPIYQTENTQNFQEALQNVRLLNEGQQQSSEAQVISETAEVQRAREEHLRIFNAIKSHNEQEQAKQNSRSLPTQSLPQKPLVELAIEEEQLLELERLREAERLQKEQQLLEMDRIREAERLAEEKRLMEAELMRLRLEDEQRLEMERLMEAKRLQQEQEQLEQLNTGAYEEIIIQNDPADQQPQIAIIEQARSQQNAQHFNNPFFKIGQLAAEPAHSLAQSTGQQSSLLKTVSGQVPIHIQQHNAVVPSNSGAVSKESVAAGVRYVASNQPNSGNKHQHLKDDYIQHKYHNVASNQPADTAVALIALEKATNDHFRAHELALEQLRLARLQSPSRTADCN